ARVAPAVSSVRGRLRRKTGAGGGPGDPLGAAYPKMPPARGVTEVAIMASALLVSRPEGPGVPAEAKTYRLLTPTGHLGFTPIEEGSFWVGVDRRPDATVADSGSCDIGPHALGADESASPRTWQEHDLDLMFRASRRLGVPMIVGSASDTGTDRGVREYAAIIRELARRY